MMMPSRGEESENALPEEQRFYYLRLMAKPGGKKEPIKTKFVRWAQPTLDNSIESSMDLESQAIRVVRTIGQAFEVCHKVAQEQTQEKLPEEIEGNNNRKSKGSIFSEESEQHDLEEKLSKVEEVSRSVSPTEERTTQASQPFLQRRRSIFQAQPVTVVQEPQTTKIGPNIDKDTKDKDAIVSNPSNEQSRSSLQPQQLPNLANPFGLGTSNPPQLGSMITSSATLPTQSHMWTPQMPSGNFQSMQSLNQRAFPSFPFYPMPMIPPSASMPFSIGSPLMVSPYATLQFHDSNPSSSRNIPDNSPENREQLSMSLDQYNQHLIRSQLDQAQQTAQVASCQVQLLRDQLTNETTARIEAQSRTHQLLNANRDLLEQVQALVNRLQILETKLSSDIHSQANQPSTSKSAFAPLEISFDKQRSEWTPKPNTRSTTFPYHDLENEARVPGPPPIDPSKPYQLQSLADIRAGSLPPIAPNDKAGNLNVNKKRRPADDVGVKTEPESGTEDTTDYSSSDQYEKNYSKALNQKNAAELFQLDVFMSNPQVMPNVSSYFSGQTSPQSLIHPLMRNEIRESMDAKPTEEEDQQYGSSIYPKRVKDKFGGVLNERKFNRMSFNAKLVKRTSPESVALRVDDSELILSDDVATKDRSIEKRCMDEEEVMRKRPERSRYANEVFMADESPIIDKIPLIYEARNRSNTHSKLMHPTTPASSSIVTAMFPPKSSPTRDLSRPSMSMLRKKSLRALSVDIVHEPLSTVGNGPISTLTNHVSEKKHSVQMIGNHEMNEMIILQEALKCGLVDSRQQLQKTKDDLDGMRSTAQLIDNPRSKLSDPALLAKLTRIPVYKNSVEKNERNRDYPENTIL